MLRTGLSGDPRFPELLRRVRSTTREAFTHPHIPFNKIVEQLHPARDLSHTALFQVMFAFQDFSNSETALEVENSAPEWPSFSELSEPGDGSPFKIDADLYAQLFKPKVATAKFDLSLHLFSTGKGLAVSWHYSTDLFEPTTVTRFAKHFDTLLHGIAEDHNKHLSSYSLITRNEKQQLAGKWNQTGSWDTETEPFTQVFEQHAEESPESPAIISDAGKSTYRALNESANRLARYLNRIGASPDTRIGIFLSEKSEVVTAIIAAWKIGAAVVICEPSYPAERIAFMLNDSAVGILITGHDLVPCPNTDDPEKSSKGRLPDPASFRTPVYIDDEKIRIGSEPSNNLPHSAIDESAAYIVYTSGSTGQPKGVIVNHRNLGYYSRVMGEILGIEAGDRYLHSAPFGFFLIATPASRSPILRRQCRPGG